MWDLNNEDYPIARRHAIAPDRSNGIICQMSQGNAIALEIDYSPLPGVYDNTEMADTLLDFDLSHRYNNPLQNTWVIDAQGQDFTEVLAIEFNGNTYQQAEFVEKIRPLEFVFLSDEQKIVICIPRPD